MKGDNNIHAARASVVTEAALAAAAAVQRLPHNYVNGISFSCGPYHWIKKSRARKLVNNFVNMSLFGNHMIRIAFDAENLVEKCVARFISAQVNFDAMITNERKAAAYHRGGEG